MFRHRDGRITVGLKGGILRVASVPEVAARLPLVVGGAPRPASGCGRACRDLQVGGLLIVAAV